MSNNNNNDIGLLAGMFKALSNPQRLRIFLTFCRCCPPGGGSPREMWDDGCVQSLGSELGLSPSTVSHHIKELRQAGLIKVERCGQRIECWIGDEVLRLLSSFFACARDGGCR